MVVESLPTGTIIVNSQGVIILLNRQVEEWFGVQRNEILGQKVECLIPERFIPKHPQYRDEYFANPKVRPMGINKDLFARRKDGSEFPVDISLHPLPMSNGFHVLVHIVNATERHRSETLQRHEESLRRMQFIVENLPAGAVYVSLSHQTLIVNRAFVQITGYSQEELTSLDGAFEILFQDRAAEVRQQHDNDRTAGFPVTRLLMIHRKDGGQAWVEMAAYRYNSHEVWLWHDVTDRLAAQVRLVQSTRLAAIGEMMTGLAHESRNALQRARAALDMLELDLEDRPDMKTLSQRAVSAVDELQRLYEEVRNYAAPIQLECREVDLEEAWQDAWGQVRQTHLEKHITLQSHCQSDARWAVIDRHRLNQVFRNILENAIAVLPEYGGVIEVTSEVIEDQGNFGMEVSIQDNGPGMNDEQKSRIFEPFFTTKTRGTGLGMAIVRRIMEAHNGTASVGESERGALIVLRFPKQGLSALPSKDRSSRMAKGVRPDS